MKIIRQITILLLISFLAEGLKRIVPLPIPSTVWGMGILFALLCTRCLKVSDVKETAHFLLVAMPIFFIPTAVGITEIWSQLRSILPAMIVISLLSTAIVFWVTGRAADRLLGKESEMTNE